MAVFEGRIQLCFLCYPRLPQCGVVPSARRSFPGSCFSLRFRRLSLRVAVFTRHCLRSPELVRKMKVSLCIPMIVSHTCSRRKKHAIALVESGFPLWATATPAGLFCTLFSISLRPSKAIKHSVRIGGGPRALQKRSQRGSLRDCGALASLGIMKHGPERASHQIAL